MRRLLLIVIAACGATSHSDSQAWQSRRASNHRVAQTACKEYQNLEACLKYGKQLLHLDADPEHPDWQEPYPIDRDGAKQALLATCNPKEAIPESREACGILLEQKLVSVEDGFTMCTASPASGMCGGLVDKAASSVNEKQWYALCEQRVYLCSKAILHLTDHDEVTYADMGSKFEDVSVKITGYAAHYDEDNDDNTAAASDSACHKDTDCKGERICQNGSCVDAGAKPPPLPKSASLGVASCDDVAHLIETQVFSCARLNDQALRDAYQDFRDVWKKVQPERLKAMAPVCTEEIERVNKNLDHVHCK